MILCFGMLHRVSDPVAVLKALADVLEPGGEVILETYGSTLDPATPAIEVHESGDVYAGDDFVYWGFPPEGLRRLARPRRLRRRSRSSTRSRSTVTPGSSPCCAPTSDAASAAARDRRS